MILNGRIAAASVYKDLKWRIAGLETAPKLAVILAGDDPASLAYIGQKRKYALSVGMEFEVVRLAAEVDEATLLQHLDELNHDSRVSGIIVQMPLPAHIDAARVISAIAPAKDVDGFTPASLGELFLGRDAGYVSCTPKGIMRLLDYYGLSVAGKRVAILGRSNIVGKPLAVLMINAGATVTSCNSKTPGIADITRVADIVVLAMGNPKFLKRDMVREWAVVIDVGFKKVEGVIHGDADFDEIKDVTAVTPVPGGVGAMTVAMLLENTVLAHERATAPALPAAATPGAPGRGLGWALILAPLSAFLALAAWVFSPLGSGVDPAIAMLWLLLAGAVAAGLMSYGLSLTARSPAGIGGGLAFIAFFIVSRAIGHAMDIAGAASSYDAAISSATDAPVAAWAFSGHIVGQAVLLLGAVAVFALLWRHSRFLPRVLLAWLVAEIAIGAVEAAWLGGLLASAGFALTGGPYDPWWIVVRSVAALAIFAAYLRLSRRARLTFVR